MAALSIAPWPTSSNTEGLKPPDLPPPASIVSRHSWGEGVTDVCLDSGLRIILKPTDFLDDDIQFSAFAWTGISQAPQERLMHGRLARSVADELGWAGIPREELLDLLAGLRLSASPSIGAYSRGIAGDCSPTDLESLLQLAHRLFTSQVNVDMERLATLHSLLTDSVLNRDKDPDGVFSRKVAEVTTCAHPYFRPMELDDLDGLAAEGEAQKIAKVFDSAFCGVDGWTLVMVGNLVVDEVLPLCCQYLGIPADAPAPDGDSPAAVAEAPLFSGQRDDITPLEVSFPDASMEVRVVRPMAGAPRSRACISFPLVLERKKGCLESLRRLTALDLAISVMDKCLRETLRFDKGGVYGSSSTKPFCSFPLKKCLIVFKENLKSFFLGRGVCKHGLRQLAAAPGHATAWRVLHRLRLRSRAAARNDCRCARRVREAASRAAECREGELNVGGVAEGSRGVSAHERLLGRGTHRVRDEHALRAPQGRPGSDLRGTPDRAAGGVGGVDAGDGARDAGRNLPGQLPRRTQDSGDSPTRRRNS